MACGCLEEAAPGRGHAEHEGSEAGLSRLGNNKEAACLEQRWGRVAGVLGLL